MKKTGVLRSKLGIMVLSSLMMLCLSACDVGAMFGGGSGGGKTSPKAEISEDGTIKGQTATGIWSGSKDFEEQLESGRFYVVQGEYYYPVPIGYIPMEEDELGTSTNPSRRMYFLSEDEVRIPTFYDDCELVYYSNTGLLDYLTWERYTDEGYTFGIWDLKSMISGRIYLTTDKDKKDTIYPGKPFTGVYDFETEPKAILIDKIGNVQATEDFLYDGMINPQDLEKNQDYDLAIYDGTFYYHVKEKADLHYFKAFEIFASIEYETMQKENFYKIEVPEYFLNGYYRINNKGLLRVVRDSDSYGPDTDFNEQLLFPYVNTNARDYDPDQYIAPARYSTYPKLNLFRTNQPDKLGYVEQDENGNWLVAIEENPENSEERAKILEATVKEIEIWLPKGVECTVEIVSSTSEKTGDIYLEIGEKKKTVPYSRLDDKYSLTLKGSDSKANLVITGLFSNYEIHLNGAEQYRNQDMKDGKESGSSEIKEKEEASSEASSSENE